jgi:GNAT superfamily N-acetyltransferase
MCDEWMPVIKLPLTLEQFHQLPRNPAYKYEYLGGEVYLSPRPRHYHALLDLAPRDPPREIGRKGDGISLRPLRFGDWVGLEPLFSGAFRSIQPFGSLEDEERREATRQSLERTRTGSDGPLIEAASFVAEQEGGLVGAILITLLPDGDPCDWDSYHWRQPPPADCISRRLGRPHLTWVFVSHGEAGRGVGTALLAAAVNALLRLGFQELLSTFMLGNESSMLWHWRNGFRLLAYPGSVRLMQARFQRLGKAKRK